jgi:hypothetical protein
MLDCVTSEVVSEIIGNVVTVLEDMQMRGDLLTVNSTVCSGAQR